MTTDILRKVGFALTPEELMDKINNLEERILSEAPSDNWAIGEKSIITSGLANAPVETGC